MHLQGVFRDLSVEVGKAVVEGDEDNIDDKFFVRMPGGGKLSKQKASEAVAALELLLSAKDAVGLTSRPKFDVAASEQGKGRLYTLMGELRYVCGRLVVVVLLKATLANCRTALGLCRGRRGRASALDLGRLPAAAHAWLTAAADATLSP